MSNDKKKVALITFHNAYNYGAAMQAYGLQETLRNMGIDAEYINYINERRREVYSTSYQIKTALKNHQTVRAVKLGLGKAFVSTRGKKFDEFYDKHLKKTDRVYKNSSEAKKLNSLYDKFIVGSDQVWNCNNNGGDTAFLLDFVDESENKISYASSFGMSDIPEGYVEPYREALNSIGRIAVREVAGAAIVEKYTGRKPHIVLDPVFVAGVDTWNKLRREGNVKKEDYIFFYTNRNSQVRDFFQLGYDNSDLKSHILSSYVGVKDFVNTNTSVRFSMSPADFLEEIASAKLVVTASFHCVAFSIIFHKQFVVFLTGNRGKDERILNLLRICGLESRIINGSTSVDDIDKKIDYDEVDRILQPYLDYSREYLKNAVLAKEDVDMLNIPDGNSKYFCDDERCSGCMACVNVCPVNAISIKKSTDGFIIPIRDRNKCIDCYKCNSVCQVFNPLKKSDYTQRYFAIKNTDDIRRNSSSGGVFTALSDRILDQGGVVCAAAMNKNFKVQHVFAKDCKKRDLMRKTLYVQSDISKVYTKIQECLDDGKQVLFVGTPCQVAGIKKYFSGIDTSNLFTCDIVCHGAPSPGVFEEFISYLKRKHGQIREFNFRDKKLGWRHGYTVSAVFKDKKIFNTLELQSFSKMFSHNLINRLSCGNCNYTNYDRVSDITIGDFWGIEKSHADYKDNLGVSLVLVNTNKGQELLDSCNTLDKLEVRKDETRQNSLIKQAEPSANRMDAFKILSHSSYEALAKKYGEVNYKGEIKQVIRRIKKL